MATHDYVINDQTTPAFRSDLNNALSAIVSNNSSASEPSSTYANMWWMDTTNNYLKIRDKNDANWIIVGEMDVTNSRMKLVSDSLQAASAGGIDILNSSGTKIIDLQVASQATAEAGTNNTELMTPLRVKQSIDENAISYPQVITVKSSGNYAIPSGAVAVLIRASGGGGGGGACIVRDNNRSTDSGDDGGNTTVTNATLSIAVTADGGKGGAVAEGATTPQSGVSTGGDVIVAGGAKGGKGHFFQRNSASGTTSAEDGYAGDLVTKYVTGSNVGGQTLTISYGSGGTGGNIGDGISTVTGSDGLAGYVEITVW